MPQGQGVRDALYSAEILGEDIIEVSARRFDRVPRFSRDGPALASFAESCPKGFEPQDHHGLARSVGWLSCRQSVIGNFFCASPIKQPPSTFPGCGIASFSALGFSLRHQVRSLVLRVKSNYGPPGSALIFFHHFEVRPTCLPAGAANLQTGRIDSCSLFQTSIS